MARREADFTQRTKFTIQYRCKHKCSNPKCRISTIQEDSKGQFYSIGKACHIEAASKKGPRYNPNSTLEERKSEKNAIWLCSTCADKIDKDELGHPAELLRAWKEAAEGTNFDHDTRIFAIANQTGGVGKSSLTVYLAQAIATITDARILCISASSYDAVGKHLLAFTKKAEKDIVPTSVENIDYMGEQAVERIYNNQIALQGRFDLSPIIKEKQYKYVLIDCGIASSDVKSGLFHMATDVILPIGDSAYSNTGIRTVGKWLEHKEEKVNLWPVYSIGLTFSNKLYRRNWYEKVWTEVNRIGKFGCVAVKIPSIIIPKSNYVNDINIDVWNSKKTQHVAEAYIKLAYDILQRRCTK